MSEVRQRRSELHAEANGFQRLLQFPERVESAEEILRGRVYERVPAGDLQEDLCEHRALGRWGGSSRRVHADEEALVSARRSRR